PGDLFRMSDGIRRYPQDFFERHRAALPVHPLLATQSQAVAARSSPLFSKPWNPPGGYKTGRVLGSVAPICLYDEDLRLRRVELHPLEWSELIPNYLGPAGIPLTAQPHRAEEILRYLADLSGRYGTKIRNIDGVGVIDVD